MKQQFLFLLLFLLIFFSSSASAYRTAEDSAKFSGVDYSVRWHLAVVGFEIVGQVPKGIDPEQFKELVLSSFDEWRDAGCMAPVFEVLPYSDEGVEAGDGISTVSWVYNGWEQMGFSAQQLAVTRLEYESDESWKIVEFDLFLNGEQYDWSSVDGPNLNHVLLHEVGHVLGLLHPCETTPDGSSEPVCSSKVPPSLMKPNYATGDGVITTDDRAGICYLYSNGVCKSQEDCAAKLVCRNELCLDPCNGVLCEEGARCIGGVCELFKCEACLGSVCTTSTGCNDGPLCKSDLCESNGVFPGDPCYEDSDCDPLVCSEDGYCSSSCNWNEECSPGWVCERLVCRADSISVLGEACSIASDCDRGVCLSIGGTKAEMLCSRSCFSGVAESCPSSWACLKVDGQEICVPQLESEAGSCIWSNRQTRANLGWSLGLVAICIAWRRYLNSFYR